jgi:hypothetical protein
MMADNQESMTDRNPKTKPVIDDPWEDLVVSLLSVNNCSLERTYQSIEGLRKERLSDPTNLEKWGHGDLVARLKAAGCDRGPFLTNLFAFRLANLGALIHSKGVDACTKVISGRDTGAIDELLLPVNGIGPKVIENFYLLRDIHVKRRIG